MNTRDAELWRAVGTHLTDTAARGLAGGGTVIRSAAVGRLAGLSGHDVARWLAVQAKAGHIKRGPNPNAPNCVDWLITPSGRERIRIAEAAP